MKMKKTLMIISMNIKNMNYKMLVVITVRDDVDGYHMNTSWRTFF
jgi:DNA gyrase/topoisomerase IV subunit B